MNAHSSTIHTSYYACAYSITLEPKSQTYNAQVSDMNIHHPRSHLPSFAKERRFEMHITQQKSREAHLGLRIGVAAGCARHKIRTYAREDSIQVRSHM